MIYCNAYNFIRAHSDALLCKAQVAADLRAFAESQGIPHEALCRALSDRYEREQKPQLGDIEKTQALAPGDACEFRYPARATWQPGRVVRNGGDGWWEVVDAGDSEGLRGMLASRLYIEHVRAVGTDPWSGCVTKSHLTGG